MNPDNSISDWCFNLLRCPDCKKELYMTDRNLNCRDCGKNIPINNSVPMIMSSDTYIDVAEKLAKIYGISDQNKIAHALASSARYRLINNCLNGEYSNTFERYHNSPTLQKNAFKEWSRLLHIGAQLHIRVPSIVDLVDLYKKEKSFRKAERQEYFIQMIYGTQAYPGDFHFCGYTVGTLTRLALSEGLYVSEATLKDGWLFDFTFKRVMNDFDLSNEEFIVHCYCSILEQIPDKKGLNYWLDQLDKNTISRENIISEFKSIQSKQRDS